MTIVGNVTRPAGQIVCRDSLCRSLLEAAARAVRRQGVDDLGWVPILGTRGGIPRELRNSALAYDAQATALPVDAVEEIDAAAVAAWVVDHYPEPTYPAVVVGSAHGGAVSLAAAMGAPWLPTDFWVTVPWHSGRISDWNGAMRYGATIAARILRSQADVTVRQVHDPVGRGPLCGSTVTLQVRWRRLPAAYRGLLRWRMVPQGGCLLVRDIRPWPVLRIGAGYTFQIGSPVNGWDHAQYTLDNPAFRSLLQMTGEDRWERPRWDTTGYAETAVEPELEPSLHRVAARADQPSNTVLYHGAEVLSAGVADFYRMWLRGEYDRGDDSLVTCGRLVDPWRTLAAGLVPYWCESASGTAVGAAEWWLATSSEFDSVTVLPQPPGTACDAHATLAQWRSLARFARSRGHVDERAANRFPMLPLPTSHAASVLAARAAAPLTPEPVAMAQVVAALRQAAPRVGLFVL